MKRLVKRLASAVLALVMLAVVSVSGYAYPDFAPDTRYIDGFFNTEGYYCVRFGNLGLLEMALYAYAYNNDISIDNWQFELTFGFDENSFDTKEGLESCTVFHTDKGNSVFLITGERTLDGRRYSYGDLFASSRYYYNDNDDLGIVAFLKADSPYLSKLANAKTLYVRTRFIADNMKLQFGDTTPYAVTPKFEGLEAYKTNTNTTNTVTKAKDISTLEIDKLSSEVYEGEKIYPDPSIYDGDYLLEEKTDYTLTYKNNDRPGTGSVTIKGKGKYTGTKTLTFKIKMKAPSLTAKKNGNSKAALSWKKAAGASGYEIYYSTNNGKFKKLTSVSGTTLGKTVTKLNFKKNSYKFKIRAVAKSSAGKSVYSSWSKTVKLG